MSASVTALPARIHSLPSASASSTRAKPRSTAARARARFAVPGGTPLKSARSRRNAGFRIAGRSIGMHAAAWRNSAALQRAQPSTAAASPPSAPAGNAASSSARISDVSSTTRPPSATTGIRRYVIPSAARSARGMISGCGHSRNGSARSVR